VASGKMLFGSGLDNGGVTSEGIDIINKAGSGLFAGNIIFDLFLHTLSLGLDMGVSIMFALLMKILIKFKKNIRKIIKKLIFLGKKLEFILTHK
jgi:hypothetical protein